MKQSILLLFMALATLSYSQIQTGELSGVTILSTEKYQEADTVPTVVYASQNRSEKTPLYYLDGVAVNQYAIKTLDPNRIQKIEVVKNDPTLGEGAEHGVIYITTKKGYTPSYIALNALKDKYIKISARPTIFLLNGKVLNVDYDQYLVDEKYILKIEVESLDQPAEGLQVEVINLITRTEENLKEANRIYLRGQKNR